MDVTLGTMLAMIIPTLAITFVGFMLKKRWDAVDKSLDRVETKMEDLNNKVDEKIQSVMDKVDRHTQTLHKRVTDTEKDVTRLDERLSMHMRPRQDP